MKIKDRFKKALFAFFKKEIDSQIKFNRGVVYNPNRNIERIHYGMQELRGEINLKIDRFQDPYEYEKQLEILRKDFFQEVMKYVEVETHDLIDPYIAPHMRCVRLSLMVGKKENRR